MTGEVALPVVALGAFLRRDAGGIDEAARIVDEAGRSVGFLVVENHGLPQAVIERVFETGRSFFGRAREEKLRYLPPDPLIPRGYQAFASRNLGKTYGLDTPPDLRERFFIGPLDLDSRRYRHLPGAGRRPSMPRTAGRAARPPTGTCSANTTGAWKRSGRA